MQVEYILYLKKKKIENLKDLEKRFKKKGKFQRKKKKKKYLKHLSLGFETKKVIHIVIYIETIYLFPRYFMFVLFLFPKDFKRWGEGG